MENKFIFQPSEVLELIENNKAVVVDVRSNDEYLRGHIKGAVNISDVFCYLSTSTAKGIKELQRTFKKHFSEAGISEDKIVIFYEDFLHSLYGGSCRGYFLCLYLGHKKSGILEAGLNGWIMQNLPIEKDPPISESCDFAISVNNNIFATKNDVLHAIDNPNIKLIDNRDRCEWLGISSSPYGVDFAPRKGRIPGAKWIEWYLFLDFSKDIPTFKTKNEIMDICKKNDLHPDDEIVIYCFKGARASNTFTALKIAGFKNVKVYFASWNEWSRIPELPVETGNPAV